MTMSQSSIPGLLRLSFLAANRAIAATVARRGKIMLITKIRVPHNVSGDNGAFNSLFCPSGAGVAALFRAGMAIVSEQQAKKWLTSNLDLLKLGANQGAGF